MKATSTPTLSRDLPNSARLAVLSLFLLATLAFVSCASAQGTTLSVKFYKHDTRQQISYAKAGSTVDLVATVVVPRNSAGSPITVNAVATLKVAGISVPYKIPMANVAVPNINPQDGGVLVQSGTQQGQIRIPSVAPKGTSINIKATATVNGSVSNPIVAKLTVS